MFDIAPSEFLLVAVVALLVIGPKDLPKAMRVAGGWIGKARGMARHFRSGIDEMMRQSELEEMEKKWQEENARIMAAYSAKEPPAMLPHPSKESLAQAGAAQAGAAQADAGETDNDGTASHQDAPLDPTEKPA